MSKSNPVGKNLVLVVVVLAGILFFLKSRDSNNVDPEAALEAENASALSEEEAYEGVTIEVGAEGDTYVDTLSTLTAKQEQLQEKLNHQDAVKVSLEEKNEQLNKQVKQANDEVKETKTNLEKLFDKVANLEDNIKNVRKSSRSTNTNLNGFASQGEYPINNGDTPRLSAPNMGGTSHTSGSDVNYDDEVVWINPIDAQATVDEQGTISLDIPEIRIGDTLRDTELYKEIADTGYGRSVGMEQEDVAGTPFITIPRGGTGIDGVALTALIGRIPIGGAVVDPYRFKAMVSGENLASNGITIDGLSGAVIGGRVTGDYALQCVTGEIDYITFTFEDGRIATFPEATEGGNSSGNALGYISDNAGVPCIAGTFISNGSSYLSQQMGLAALNAGAKAYSQSATATSITPEGATSTVKEADTFAYGEMASAGIDTASEWLTQRQQSAFDAVYVAPSSRITVHFEREISINYNSNGRKTNHADYMQASKDGYDYAGLN